MKRKIITLVLAVMMALSFVACGNTPENNSSEENEKMTEQEIEQLYADPKKFEGRSIEIYGQLLNSPEKDDSGIYFQMWADPENANLNTVVYFDDPDFQVEVENYVKVSGVVGKEFEGENAFGGTVTAPTIIADSVEVVSYTEAVSPALHTYEFDNLVQDQYGYSVKIDKVELAENETRIYLTVNNNGSDKFSLYSFNSSIIQNGEQFNEQDNWAANYPEIQTDLNVGASTNGVIAFPAIENANFQLILDGYSSNYNENIEPYTFDIPVNQ